MIAIGPKQILSTVAAVGWLTLEAARTTKPEQRKKLLTMAFDLRVVYHCCLQAMPHDPQTSQPLPILSTDTPCPLRSFLASLKPIADIANQTIDVHARYLDELLEAMYLEIHGPTNNPADGM